MPSPLRILLTVGPLSVYLFTLGAWQSGRDARVQRGDLDFGLLAFGLGGLVSFGPIGQALIHIAFPGPSRWATLAIPACLILAVLVAAPRFRRRLVVYNVDADRLDAAILHVVGDLGRFGHFDRTLRGLEDRSAGRGVWWATSARFRTATIEVFGDRADEFVSALAPPLRLRLGGTGRRGSGISRACFWLALLILWGPMFGSILARGSIRSALRAFFARIFG